VVFSDQFLNSTNFCPLKSIATLQSNWVKPKLRNFVITLNVNMRRFIAVTRIKEETIWADS